MKLLIQGAILYCVCSASTCKDDGPCHTTISLENRTADTLWHGRPVYFGSVEKCALFGDVILPLPTAYVTSGTCWEQELGVSQPLYIVKYPNFNPVPIDGIGYYDCDSVTFKNEVVKVVTLNLEELSNNNFTINID